MAKDRLEKIITENREYFDDKKPSSKLWSSIRFRLGIATTSSGSFWWKAAAIVFFALSVFLVIDRMTVSEQNLASLATEFSQTESYYLQVIDEKKQLINGLTDDTVLGEEAERDLQRLDAMYEVLKEEYCQNPSKQVVDALVLNLLVKIDILNDEIEVMDEDSDSDEVSI